MSEVCDWPVGYCGPECEQILAALNPADRADIEAAAVNKLWQWTGRRFGLCPVTIRPCLDVCHGGCNYRTPWGSSYGGCGCYCSAEEVLLPGPVVEIVDITIDGVPLDLADVRVDNHSLLVREDGGRWPHTQDLNVDGDQPGAWQVTYRMGEPVPPMGRLVAGVLACEMAKSICQDGSCRLPKRVNVIERQGIEIAGVAVDTFDDLSRGATGIYEVDDWVATQNAYKTRRGGYASSPDVDRPRFTTWRLGAS